MIVEQIAEQSALYISSQNKMPKRIYISAEDLKALLHERPDTVEFPNVWGLEIVLAAAGVPLTVGE